MTKALIITEKPSVARDIVEALGGFANHDDQYWENDRYFCTFAVGHLLELLEPEDIDAVYKRWTMDTLPIIPETFSLKPKEGQTERLRVIKKLMQRPDVTELINACDAGREGELIFRELVKFHNPGKPIRRLWLQSMTADAIRQGFQSLQDGKKFDGLAAAAELRSIADWLIGMNASRALTIRLRSRAAPGAWSAGRVQTPTLALLVDRELEVLSHVPQPYWRVVGQFAAGTQRYAGAWFDPNFRAGDAQPHRKADRIFDEAQAKALVEKVRGQAGLASETRKPSRETAPPLFDLTSLQREANRRFGWSAARTLQAAQRCYEQHKALTYPRTDSRCLPNDYVKEVERVIGELARHPDYSASALHLTRHGRQNDAKVFNDAGVSDHFAIIPTGVLPAHLKADDVRLFDLVVRRFLGAFFPPAIWENVERTTIVAGEHFIAKARALKAPGWRTVFAQEAADDEGAKLPPLIEGQDNAHGVAVATVDAQTEADATRPPPRITEAKLLSLMENAGQQIEDEELAAVLHEKGLGTPATRADIIENLKSKGYVDYSLRPTAKGMRLIDLLHRIHAGRIASAELTGELEWHLREVEHNQRKPADYLGEIIEYTREIVHATKTFEYEEIFPNQDPVGVCPCPNRRPVYERSWFYRCQECPAELEADNDCKFRIWKDKSGRYLDRQTVATLLRDGKTGVVEGFRDRQGRTYSGVLVIEDKQVVVQPVAGSEQASGEPARTFEVNPEPLGKCPCADCKDCAVIETPTEFICTTRKAQIEAGEKKPRGFLLPRIVCKREMTRADALAYIANQETPILDDFISRFNRPFAAKLKLKPDGRHAFEFPPREGRGGRRGGRKAPSGASAENAAKEATTSKPTRTKSAGKRAAGKTAGAKKPAKKAPKKTTKKASTPTVG